MRHSSHFCANTSLQHHECAKFNSKSSCSFHVKHIQIYYHYVGKSVALKLFEIAYAPTTEQATEIFIKLKPMSSPNFQDLESNLNLDLDLLEGVLRVRLNCNLMNHIRSISKVTFEGYTYIKITMTIDSSGRVRQIIVVCLNIVILFLFFEILLTMIQNLT